MAVTLENLYKPINDFFIGRFKAEDDTRICFRFDQFGTKIAAEDFVEPRNGEEVFSDFVNRMPQLDAEGLNVRFSAKRIDQSYFYELVSPALPFIPSGLDAADEQALRNNFAKLQHKALADYELLWQARSGVGDKFWVSYPSPLSWYDNDKTTFWEEYNFEAVEKKEAAAVSGGLWKLRLKEAELREIVADLTVKKAAVPMTKLVEIKPMLLMAKPINKAHLTRQAAVLQPGVQQNFKASYAELNLIDKMAVIDKIKKLAPSKEVVASRIAVHFQFAIVQIRRPWLFDVFLDDDNWRIPGKQLGEITKAGDFSHLPTAFIMVKNLKITANWSSSDRENSQEATNFGPFQLSGAIGENGSVGYDGIQVIGWVLQEMSSFPPK